MRDSQVESTCSSHCPYSTEQYCFMSRSLMQGRLAGEGMQLTSDAQGPYADSDDGGRGQMGGEDGQWRRQQQASPTGSAAAN